MTKHVMVCGVDCQPGASNCNGYCVGKTSHPPEATEAQMLDTARAAAHRALDAAEKAWYEYAGRCEVGPERTRAFNTHANLRRARLA